MPWLLVRPVIWDDAVTALLTIFPFALVPNHNAPATGRQILIFVGTRMTPISDLYAILKGDGIALDEAECAALGGPTGETISLWCAMQARHGSALAHLACLGLWLVQRHHCRDQLAGVPMQPVNYAVAFGLLVVFAPFAFLFSGVRWALRRLRSSH